MGHNRDEDGGRGIELIYGIKATVEENLIDCKKTWKIKYLVIGKDGKKY